MISNAVKRSVFLMSFIITVLIFCSGLMLNYGFDKIRLSRINSVLESNSLDIQAYALEQEFIETSEINTCSYLIDRITVMKNDLKSVVDDLNKYQGKSIFNKKEFELVKRKYVLIELNFYSLLLKANDECGRLYFPMLFFYSVDDEASISQSFIIDEFLKEHNESAMIFTFDYDFENEPLQNILIRNYNITGTPFMILNTNITSDTVIRQKSLELYLDDFFDNDSFYQN